MLTLPMFPYYTHSHRHWSNVASKNDAWQLDYKDWIVTQHVAHVATTNLYEFYTFETEPHRTWFALRWG